MAAGRWEWVFRGWLIWEVRCPAWHSLGTAGRDQTQQVWEIFGIRQLGRQRIKAGLGVLPKAVYFCMGIMEGTTQGWWSSVEEGSCEEQGVVMCPRCGADPTPLRARTQEHGEAGFEEVIWLKAGCFSP